MMSGRQPREMRVMRSLTEWGGGSPEERALLAQCREAVGRMLPNAEVILYGSRARLQLPGLELVRVSCHAIYPAGRAGRYRLMTPETRMLVQYRLDRSREALAEAVLLLDSGHANTGVNRLYYACFYAGSALLLTQGLTAPHQCPALARRTALPMSSCSPTAGWFSRLTQNQDTASCRHRCIN